MRDFWRYLSAVLLALLLSLWYTQSSTPRRSDTCEHPFCSPKMALPLDRVAAQLVTDDNPPDYDVNGMDTDRCVALHNAILEHGWIASGRSAADFEANTRTWWTEYGASTDVGRLHPSLRAFLTQARVVPYGYQPDTSFFFNVRGLLVPSRFWEGPASSIFEDENMILTLYYSHEKLAGTPDGML